jgi:hypothetical protein
MEMSDNKEQRRTKDRDNDGSLDSAVVESLVTLLGEYPSILTLSLEETFSRLSTSTTALLHPTRW